MDRVGLAQLFGPQFLGDVRGDGSQHLQVDLLRFLPGVAASRARFSRLVHFVQQFHQCGDDRVELKVLEVTRHLAQGLVDLAAQILLRFFGTSPGQGWVGEQGPGTADPAGGSFDALRVPRRTHLPAREEHQVGAYGVSAVFVHQDVWRDHVAAALGHLLVVLAQHHALIAQLDHRLVAFGDARIAQRLMEEARVQQVHRGVLDAARVGIHGHPVIVFGLIERTLVIFRRQVAQVIPRRAHERVHRVGLALGRSAAHGTGGVLPGRVQLQRRLAGRLPLHVLGQGYGQLVIGHGIPAVDRAVDHRDGRAPITLTADQPVAIAIVDRFLADAFFFQPIDDRRNAGILASFLIVDSGPVKLGGVDHRARADIGLGHGVAIQVGLALRLDDRNDLQPVLAGKGEVAFVVGGDSHDGARAVRHQHVIRDPDRDARAVDRVDGVPAGEHTGLLLVHRAALDVRLTCSLDFVLVHGNLVLGRGDLVHQRMLG